MFRINSFGENIIFLVSDTIACMCKYLERNQQHIDVSYIVWYIYIERPISFGTSILMILHLFMIVVWS